MKAQDMRAALSAMLPTREVKVSVRRAKDAEDFDTYRLTFDGLSSDERERVKAWLLSLGLRCVSCENVGGRWNWSKVMEVWPVGGVS